MRVGESRTGRGVFAIEPIVAGERIGRIDGRIVSASEATKDHFDLEHRELVLVPRSPFRYLNHSCAPNAAVALVERPGRRPLLLLESLRDIAVGEEITIDYGFAAEDAFPCECGVAHCRGWVVAASELSRLPRAGRSSRTA
jgi:SET domain-containing protein